MSNHSLFVLPHVTRNKKTRRSKIGSQVKRSSTPMSKHTVNTQRPLRAYVERRAFDLMRAGTAAMGSDEIGGFFHVSVIGDKPLSDPTAELWIHTASIPPQEVCSTEVDLTKGMAIQAEESHTLGLSEQLKGWWHSHHNMSVFLSGTDWTCVRDFGVTADWWVTLITNHANEWEALLHVFNVPFVGRVDIELELVPTVSEGIHDEVAVLIKENVEKVKWTYQYSHGGYGGSSSSASKSNGASSGKATTRDKGRAKVSENEQKGEESSNGSSNSSASGDSTNQFDGIDWKGRQVEFREIGEQFFAVDLETGKCFDTELNSPNYGKLTDVSFEALQEMCGEKPTT